MMNSRLLRATLVLLLGFLSASYGMLSSEENFAKKRRLDFETREWPKQVERYISRNGNTRRLDKAQRDVIRKVMLANRGSTLLSTFGWPKATLEADSFLLNFNFCEPFCSLHAAGDAIQEWQLIRTTNVCGDRFAVVRIDGEGAILESHWHDGLRAYTAVNATLVRDNGTTELLLKASDSSGLITPLQKTELRIPISRDKTDIVMTRFYTNITAW